MPVVNRSNNRILPPNSRAADVATKAIQEIAPVQQAKYYNAFRVQGIQAILYNGLGQGKPCTCQAASKSLNTRLNKDGKAPVGMINSLLTGDKTFTISAYGSHPFDDADKENSVTSPYAPVNKHQGQFDIRSLDESYPNSNVTEGFGDNGPVSTIDIDDLVSDFDSSALGFTDVACAICFGTGFVGGYSPFHGHRAVLPVSDLILQEAAIQYQEKPWTVEIHNTYFEFMLVFPKGGIGVDCFRVMNNHKALGATFEIDDSPVRSVKDILHFCDGLPHKVKAIVPQGSILTHVEVQFNLTNEPVYFEFPRLSKSGDTAVLDPTQPFTILLSPNVPALKAKDIIVESMAGQVLIVGSVNPWKTTQRSMLGWECEVRVIQPTELFQILPKRGRVKTKDETTQLVHDNVRGPRRT